MSNLLVPFDYNPASITIKTTAYTVPSGKYALVKPIYPYLSINGTAMYPAQSLSIAAPITTTSSTYIHVPYGAYITGTFNRNGSGSNTSSGSYGYGTAGAAQAWIQTLSRTTNGTTSFSPNYITVSEIWITATHGSTGSGTSTTAISLYSFTGSNNNYFWVPSGTVLDGAKYTVEEYNVIS